jgi:hypothetical protein
MFWPSFCTSLDQNGWAITMHNSARLWMLVHAVGIEPTATRLSGEALTVRTDVHVFDWCVRTGLNRRQPPCRDGTLPLSYGREKRIGAPRCVRELRRRWAIKPLCWCYAAKGHLSFHCNRNAIPCLVRTEGLEPTLRRTGS